LRFDYLAFGLPPKGGLPPNRSIFISPQASHQLNPALQVKLRDPLRTRVIPERLRSVFTARRYTNSRSPLPLPLERSAPLQHVTSAPWDVINVCNVYIKKLTNAFVIFCHVY